MSANSSVGLTSEALPIRAGKAGFPECIPRDSATATCSAATYLSYSEDLFSSSFLCRNAVARPFSISCSATLLQARVLSGLAENRTANLRIRISVMNSGTFPCFKLPFGRPDKVDFHANMLADEFLTQKLCMTK